MLTYPRPNLRDAHVTWDRDRRELGVYGAHRATRRPHRQRAVVDAVAVLP